MITIGRRIVVDCEDLIAEHAQIDRLSRDLEELAQQSAPQVERAQDLLRSLARVVAAHLRKEESFVYPGLTSASDRSGAMGLVLDFEAMKQSWEDYLGAWQKAGALAEWGRFRSDTREALQSLRERAMAEVDDLYAIALREGLVTLRSATGQESMEGKRARANR